MALPIIPLLLLGGAALVLTSKKPKKTGSKTEENRFKVLRKNDSELCVLGPSDMTFEDFDNFMRPFEPWAEAGAKRGARSLKMTGIYLKMDEDLIEATCDWFPPPLGATQDETYVAPLQVTMLISAEKLMAKANDCSAARWPLTGLKDIAAMVGTVAPNAPLDTEGKILELQAALGLKICEDLMDPSTIGFMMQVTMPMVPNQDMKVPVPRYSLVKRNSNGTLTTEEFSIAEKLGIPTSKTPENPAAPPSLSNLPAVPEGLNLEIVGADPQNKRIIARANGPTSQIAASAYMDQLSSLSSPPLTQIVAILTTDDARSIQQILADRVGFVLFEFELHWLSPSEAEKAVEIINSYSVGGGTKTLVAEKVEIGTANEKVNMYILDNETLSLTPILGVK